MSVKCELSQVFLSKHINVGDREGKKDLLRI